MFQPLNEQTAQAWIDRLGRIDRDAEPRFGSLTAHRLLPHLRRTLEISLGEVDTPFVGNRFTRTALMKWFVIDAPVPWPKGRIKAPASFTPTPTGDWAAEWAQLAAAVGRFAKEADARPEARVGTSPILGPLPTRRWAKLHGRHFEHHCRQFGV